MGTCATVSSHATQTAPPPPQVVSSQSLPSRRRPHRRHCLKLHLLLCKTVLLPPSLRLHLPLRPMLPRKLYYLICCRSAGRDEGQEGQGQHGAGGDQRHGGRRGRQLRAYHDHDKCRRAGTGRRHEDADGGIFMMLQEEHEREHDALRASRQTF